MRRRSERKKSSSPAPVPARRSRRSRKVSESEKTEDETIVQKEVDATEPPPATASREEINEQPRASSEEPVGSPVRKSRASRATPKKRTEVKSGEKKVDTIPEEEAENGQDLGSSNNVEKEKEADSKVSEPEAEAINALATKEAANNEQEEAPEEEAKPESIAAEDTEDGKEEEAGQPQMDDAANEDDENCKGEQIEEVKVPSPSGSLTAGKDEEQLKTSSDVLDIQIEDVEERDEEAPASSPAGSQRPERRDLRKKHKDQKPERERSPAKDQDQGQGQGDEEEQKENRKQAAEDKPEETLDEIADLQKDKHDSSAINNTNSSSTTTTINTTTSTAPGAVLQQQQRSVKKRRWLTNKKSDRAPPVLAISTDSLKNIIDDVVQPVPLSDVQLDSSSEEEGLVTSDRDSDRSASATRANSEAHKDRECDNDNNVADGTGAESSSADKESAGAATVRTTPPPATADSVVKAQGKATVATAAPHVVRSPSPARNRASHVLYITNLVRPFTVLQLKGLLARTGKIVDEDGFWIDRIKSKCFVAYSTEDEAIETRHALHGVRWPVSNPKCLNVDFGSRTDMDRAIQSTKDEAPRYGQENTRDNQQAGNTWSRLEATDKKPVRPVREWDVGKKEPTDHDNKANNDRRRGGSKDRLEPRSRDAERAAGQDRKRSRDREVRGGGRERERIVGGDRNVPGRSRSGSPVAKNKKKDNEPPIRLLDDLFRKTKGTPCIYWLPLTPEAIAEKEAFRQKRIEEHKQRVKEREDRQKERDKDRERQRETRRNRSNERRRSRSRDRDRRRY